MRKLRLPRLPTVERRPRSAFGRRHRPRRTPPTSSSAACISRPRATRWRSGASTAPCATSIRSGTAGQGDLRGGAEGRSDLRHRLLGHRAEPVGQSAQSAAGGQQRARAGSHPEGQGDRRQDAARARLHRCAGALYTDYDKTPYRTRLMAHVKAMEALAQRYPKDDEAQIAYAIRSTSRRRSTTRPMRSSSRARRSWSRSQSGCRSIPASPTT